MTKKSRLLPFQRVRCFHRLAERDKDGAMTLTVGVRKNNTLVAGRTVYHALSSHLFTTWTLLRRADHQTMTSRFRSVLKDKKENIFLIIRSSETFGGIGNNFLGSLFVPFMRQCVYALCVLPRPSRVFVGCLLFRCNCFFVIFVLLSEVG